MGQQGLCHALRQRGEHVIGYLNLDMIGWDGNGDRVVEIHTGSGPKSNALGTEFLNRDRYQLGLVLNARRTTASRFSDHSPFWDNDYASFLVIENFFDDAIARDRNPYYHNTGDCRCASTTITLPASPVLPWRQPIEMGGYKPAGRTHTNPDRHAYPPTDGHADPANCIQPAGQRRL